MQPMAYSKLMLPITDFKTSELISNDFQAVAKNYELVDRYGFGPKSNLIDHLIDEWNRVIIFCFPVYPGIDKQPTLFSPTATTLPPC